MKYVIVQGDGMGDFLQREDGLPSSLESAKTPHMDRIAGCGELGLVHTIPEGMPPGSDVGHLSLFGYDPRQYYTGRSPLEAIAMGVQLQPEDISFRMNLVALRGEGDDMEMADYSGGHIDNESARVLVESIQQELGDETFQFFPGVGYRHLLVWRNGLEAMETTPPHDISDKPIAPHLPKGEGSDQLNRIMNATRKIMAGHPLNRQRAEEGKIPISQGWLWGQGRALQLPGFADLYQLKGAVISAVDLVRGVAAGAGFNIIEVPGATGYLDTDYTAKGQYALDALKDHDLIFIHVEAPDEAGHMGNREEKIKAIESIDEKILGPMLRELKSGEDFKILVTSDHATPVSTRTHCPDPVPFAMARQQQLATEVASIKYGESEAGKSALIVQHGHTLINRFLSD